MPAQTEVTESNLSVSLLQISSICNEFADTWNVESAKQIHVWLSKVPTTHQPALLRNLLSIDLTRRKMLGQTPETQDYVPILEELASTVQEKLLASTILQETFATPTVSFTAKVEPKPKRSTLPSGFRLGDYVLESELGRGGMGVVFVARHAKLGTQVALKTLPGTSAGELHRFKLEFRTLANINHPNLIGLHNLQADAGQWFFTMDLVEGCNLVEYVRPQGKLDQNRLREVLPQLVRGIHALHENSIIHRDLKPSNVMVTREGRVLILDFGLVADLDRVAKSQDEVVIAGTPPYMAPEQFELQSALPAVDWYALGIILYEAISGRLPFTGSLADIFNAKQRDGYTRLGKDVCPDLIDLCERLLAVEPLNRPSFADIASTVVLHDAPTHREQLAGPSANSSLRASQSTSIEAKQSISIALAGRNQELQQINEIVQGMRQHPSLQLIMISARSGEGKTFLADHVLGPMWKDDGYYVLAGRCYDRESVPFKAVDNLIDALCGRLLTLPSDTVKPLLTPDVAVLAQLFPVLQRVRAIAALGGVRLDNYQPEQVRGIAAGALRTLLTQLTRIKKVACFIDDLQWGDRDSAELLWEVFEHPEPPPVLMLATYRSDEADSSPFLQAWKSRTSEQPTGFSQHDIELKPLSLQQGIDLVLATVGVDNEQVRRWAAEIAEETNRNPFLLSELASCYDPNSQDEHPVHLKDVIERKLRKLPDDARRLLDVVCVSGQALVAKEAAVSAGHELVSLATINRMRSERLLRLVGDENSLILDTYHDRVRETVLHELSPDTRCELHVALARTIEKSAHGQQDTVGNPRVYDLAYHFFEGCGGEAWKDVGLANKAFTYSMEAGKQALSAYAYDDAVGLLQKADKLKVEQSTADAYRLQYLLASARERTREVGTSIVHYQSAIELTSNPIERAECKAGLGDVHLKLGNIPAAQEALAAALAELGEKQPRTLIGKLYGIMLSDFQFLFLPKFLHFQNRSRSLEAKRLIAKIYHVFSTTIANKNGTAAFYAVTRNAVVQKYVPDTPTRAMAFSTYAYFNSMGGMGWKGKRFRIWAEQQLVAEPAEWWQAAVAQNLGSYYLFVGNFPRAEELLTASLSLFRKSRDWQYSLALHWLRHTHSAEGDVSKILETSTAERANASHTKDTVIDAWGKYGMADGLARQGEYSEALRLTTEAEAVLEGSSHHVCMQELARVQLNASQYLEAAATAKIAVKEFLSCVLVEIAADSFPLLLESLLQDQWWKGRSAIPKKQLRAAWFYANFVFLMGLNFPSLRAHCTRVRGRLAAACGKKRKAERLFTQAIAKAEHCGARYEMARAFLDRSRVSPTTAREDQAHGQRILQKLGCVLPPKER
ncbi:MAG: protein kinase [Pirellulaceae bacterium]|nr:protein kinase [Pirellulaceae bacterium]